MDYFNEKYFFIGLCFFSLFGGAALAPPRVSGLPQTPFYFLNETNENTTLFSFIVTDEGPLTVTPSDEITRNIAVAEVQEIKHASSTPQYNVTVRTIKPLDRDTGTHGQSLYTIKFNIQDSEGNTVSVPGVYIQVNDINDNPPVFTNRPYRWYINEKPFNDTAVFKSIGAYDYDSDQNSRLTYSMTPTTITLSAINDYNSHFNISPDTGEIKLLKDLDYEENSYYQFTVMVQDHGDPPLNDTADLIIRVNDVQDTPPFFTANLYRANIDENVRVNTSVIQVNARDGDLGVSNLVSYTIFPDGGCSQLFQIHTDGTIRTNATIDRDSGVILKGNGRCILKVQVNEINQTMFTQYGASSAETNVTITINDLDDNSPKFNKSMYIGTIMENAGEGVAIQIHGGVYVSDADQEDYAKLNISVRFANGSPCPTFAAVPSVITQYSEIKITVTNDNNDMLLDYERTKSFDLLVTVAETFNATSSATATVKVIVIDVNDNVPQFLYGAYEFNIHENPANGTSVGKVTATDKDMNGTETLSYSLLGGQWFTINNATGEIYTNCAPNKLDIERQDTFYMTLTVTDTAGHRNTSSLVVTLTDENDNDPEFRQDVYEVRVIENINYKDPIISVKATDADMERSNNSLLYYNITQTSDDNFINNITVNKSTGEVFLRQSIDYEAINPNLTGIINITIKAFDNGQPQRNDTTVVRLTVQDMNDCVPIFNEPAYAGETFENETSKLGAEFVVATVKATDMDGTDRNREINYFIVSGSAGKFKVDPISGNVSIQVDTELDYERVKNYTLTVMALDQGSPPLNSTATVNITIKDINDSLIRVNEVTVSEYMKATSSATTTVKVTVNDVNDNVTHFLNDLVFDFMNVNISESATIGSHVINVHAASLSGGNDTLTYSILGGNEGYRFAIDRLTGEVILSALLDWEAISSYKLVIRASNNHGSSSQVKLNIHVLDANDNAPVFSQMDYGEHRVLETDVIGTRILNVTAFDVDEGANKDILYTLEGAFSLFSISRNGSITVAGSLRDKVGLYNITAKAIDNGVPSLTGTVMVLIRVEDANLNNPVIGNLPEGLTIKLFDCEAVGSTVWLFNYTDNDEGINAQATFTSVEFPEPLTANNQTFKVTPDGKLVLTKPLHQNIQRVYKFIVLVTDHGLPVPLSGDLPLTIRVVDVHNRLPSFASSWISMSLRENTVFGTVGHVNATMLDLDSIPCYSLNELTRFNWTRYFNLNKHTGELTNIMPLDFEMVKEITLSVHVDDCSMHANASCANNRGQGQNAMISDTNVRITIEDVNDNPPVFLNHSLFVEIINGIRPGNVLDLQLKNGTYVLDQDSPTNGINAWTFENDGYVIASASFKDKFLPDSGLELCEDNFTHPFCVTSNGTIVANIAIDESMSGFFYMSIKVKDAVGDDKTNVTIFVIGSSHLASMIVRQPVASVFVIKDDIMRLYSNLTGYQFIFDKLSDHVKSNGDIVTSRSDFQYHVLHPVDGRILSHEEIKRLLENIMDDPRFINMLNLYHIETSIQ